MSFCSYIQQNTFHFKNDHKANTYNKCSVENYNYTQYSTKNMDIHILFIHDISVCWTSHNSFLKEHGCLLLFVFIVFQVETTVNFKTNIINLGMSRYKGVNVMLHLKILHEGPS